MHRSLVPVAEITPEVRNWTAKVLVMQKLSPRQSQISARKFQKLVFIDKDETQVQAIIYSPDVGLMEHVLQLQETYYISNARVQFVDPQYRMVSHSFQWVINRATAIRHVMDASLPRELGVPRFTRFSDIPLFLNTKTTIDVLAIVIDNLEQKVVNSKFGGSSTVQELFVVNDERTPTLLSLWNEVIFSEGTVVLNTTERMPIIAATGLNVSDYKGTSLAARCFTSIIVNQPYPEAQNLRNWRANNHTFLCELVRERKYLQHSSPQTIIPHDNFSCVANVITNDTDDKFWVKVQANITDKGQKFWYMACNSCLKGTTGQYEWKIICNFCRAETVARPRTRFVVTLSDKLTQLDVVVFGELAEKLIGLSAVELMKLDEEDKILNFSNINEHLKHKEYIVQIKKKMGESYYGTEYRYTVTSLVEADKPSMEAQVQECSSSSSPTKEASEASHSNLDSLY